VKHFEKILFLVCVLAVGGLAAWVLLAKPGTAPRSGVVPPVSASLELQEYEGVPEIPEAEWDAPVPQDAEGRWIYSVFTPPILYLVDGRFDPRPPEPPEEEEDEVEKRPFGVELAEIIRRKYRLQLDAVYEVELDDIDSAVLSFENVYATENERPTISLRKGETSERHQFRVEDIRKEERIIGGGLETEHVATITDLETGKTLLLSDDRTLFEEGVTFVFESTETAGETARVENVGETFEMNDATYTLSEINLDQRSVELVKEAEFLDVPERKTLSLEAGSVPPEVTSPQGQGGELPEGVPNQDDLTDFFEQ
jgi:hypothetical protein